MEERGVASLPAPHARCRCADASTCLAGTITRRAPALAAVFAEGVRKTWSAGCGEWRTLGCFEPRSLAEQRIVRLILDGTVVRVRLDRYVTSISLLSSSASQDERTELFAVKNIGGETTEAGGRR